MNLAQRHAVSTLRSSALTVVSALTCLLFCATAVAGLKAKAPKDVDLSGRWKLMPELSEDPHAAVEEAQAEMEEKRAKEEPRKEKKGRGRGGIGMPGGGGRMPPGESPPDPDSDSRREPPGGAGRGPRQRDDDDEHLNLRDRMATLEQRITTPVEFAIQQEGGAFVLLLPESTDTCKTSKPDQVSVPGAGTAERHCGWNHRAFVVEVAQKKALTHTTRYELDKETGRLLVTSEIKGERLPDIEVKRVYEKVE